MTDSDIHVVFANRIVEKKIVKTWAEREIRNYIKYINLYNELNRETRQYHSGRTIICDINAFKY